MHAGVDLIELQIPFSEPMADGPVILRANQEALAGGATVERCFEVAGEMARRFDVPFLFMSYYNVLYKRGVAAFVSAALDHFGRIDGLVNNAGIVDPHVPPVDALPFTEWNRRLSSLHGAFLCSRHALPALRQGDGGAIVNIASTRAHQSEPHGEAYAAAKGGLLAFTHALAASEGPRVRVNSISPGWIATEAWRAPARRRMPKLSRTDHAQPPAGRVGTPEDVAMLAVYLLAPGLSGFVTGQEFVVDGGMTRKMQYA